MSQASALGRLQLAQHLNVTLRVHICAFKLVSNDKVRAAGSQRNAQVHVVFHFKCGSLRFRDHFEHIVLNASDHNGNQTDYYYLGECKKLK